VTSVFSMSRYTCVQNSPMEGNCMEDEIEELMIEALGLDDGPNLESETDLREWFAEMDEDDWNDLNEYTSDTDADSSGCGPAMYDSSDGPREHDEEELMSPPNLPNGGGGGSVGDTCPGEWSYDSWDECRLYHDYETCADLCFGEYEEGSGPDMDSEYWSCVSMEVSLFCADWSFFCTKLCPGLVYSCLVDPSRITCVPALICMGLPATWGMVNCAD